MTANRPQNPSANKKHRKPSMAAAERINSGRRRSPRRSAHCAIKGFKITRSHNPADSSRPISGAVSPRAFKNTGQNGAITPTTAKTAPKKKERRNACTVGVAMNSI